MTLYQKLFVVISTYLLSLSAMAQSGRWDFSSDLGNEAVSDSSFGLYIIGIVYLLGIFFGGKAIREVLFGIALALAGFCIYAFALFKIGSALNVWTSGDTPKNREISSYGLVFF
jgi:hypothetical protein